MKYCRLVTIITETQSEISNKYVYLHINKNILIYMKRELKEEASHPLNHFRCVVFFFLLFASVFLLSAFCISYVFSDRVFDLSGPLYISFLKGLHQRVTSALELQNVTQYFLFGSERKG